MTSLQHPLATIEPASIGCIFVIFNPRADVANKVQKFAQFGYKVVVVSNGADFNVLETIGGNANTLLIRNASNVGLATALNQGIVAAIDNFAVSFVALFDQDSAPDLRMPLDLAEELQFRASCNAACIGPQLSDIKSERANYGRHNKLAGELIVSSIPTSGTVIPAWVFAKVGLMNDALFIDGIDHEWCARATKSGLKILVSRSTTMSHDMGDLALNWFGQYKPLYSNPLRHFYIVRNSVYLALHGDFPLRWRLLELAKTFRRIPAYLWASSRRMRSIKLMAKGLFDGASGKLGPLV